MNESERVALIRGYLDGEGLAEFDALIARATLDAAKVREDLSRWVERERQSADEHAGGRGDRSYVDRMMASFYVGRLDAMAQCLGKLEAGEWNLE